MATEITKYQANDGKEFDSMEEAEARDIEIRLGKQADAFIETLGLSKGGKMLKARLLKWEAYKEAIADFDAAAEAEVTEE